MFSAADTLEVELEGSKPPLKMIDSATENYLQPILSTSSPHNLFP
jgi:hypothetical protein